MNKLKLLYPLKEYKSIKKPLESGFFLSLTIICKQLVFQLVLEELE